MGLAFNCYVGKENNICALSKKNEKELSIEFGLVLKYVLTFFIFLNWLTSLEMLKEWAL